LEILRLLRAFRSLSASDFSLKTLPPPASTLAVRAVSAVENGSTVWIVCRSTVAAGGDRGPMFDV
jgi:hypothetical protein